MNHTEYKEMLSALLDGELSAAERGEAQAHMAACAECRQYFAELNALRDALREPDGYGAPADFAEGVLARLHAEEKTVKKRRFPRGLAALAACAAVVVLAVATLPRMGMGGAAPQAPEAAPAQVTSASPAEARDEAVSEATVYSAMTASPAPQERPAPTSAAPEESLEPTSSAPESAEARGADNGLKVMVLPAPGAQAASGSSEPAAALTEQDVPTVLLRGEDAAAWLAENGWQGESGDWYVEMAALRALPELLGAEDAALDAEYAGAVRVELEEAAP